MGNAVEIVYEDASMIVVYKEAGMPTETSLLTATDLVSEVKNYLSTKNQEKNPFIGVINRLDQPVEGLVLFGKTKESTAVLSKELQDGKIGKWYYALVFGKRKDQREKLEQYLVQDRKKNLSRVGKKEEKTAKYASLFYEVVDEKEELQLLRVQLETGRHHQIRVQLSSTGTPLVGDRKYGSEESCRFSEKNQVKYPSLCAYRLQLRHPVSGKEMTIEREPKESLMGVYVREAKKQ